MTVNTSEYTEEEEEEQFGQRWKENNTLEKLLKESNIIIIL